MRKLNRRGKRRAIKGVKRYTKMSNIQGTKIELEKRGLKKGKMTTLSSNLHVAMSEWPWAGLEPSKGRMTVMEESADFPLGLRPWTLSPLPSPALCSG